MPGWISSGLSISGPKVLPSKSLLPRGLFPMSMVTFATAPQIVGHGIKICMCAILFRLSIWWLLLLHMDHSMSKNIEPLSDFYVTWLAGSTSLLISRFRSCVASILQPSKNWILEAIPDLTKHIRTSFLLNLCGHFLDESVTHESFFIRCSKINEFACQGQR